MFSRAAAINWPGAVLSQEARQSMPSRSAPSTATSMSLVIRSRSEEHTSELQSPCNLVCRLLLEKKDGGLDAHSSQTVHHRHRPDHLRMFPDYAAVADTSPRRSATVLQRVTYMILVVRYQGLPRRLANLRQELASHRVELPDLPSSRQA